MCVYECTEKPFDGWVETLVKHEVHRYLSTSEWINAAEVLWPTAVWHGTADFSLEFETNFFEESFEWAKLTKCFLK